MSFSIAQVASAVTLSSAVLQALQSFQERVLTLTTHAVQGALDLQAAEMDLLDAAHRAVRAALGSLLLATQPTEEAVLLEGVCYRRMEKPSLGTYFSLHGTVEVSRFLYRQTGLRNGPTIVPMDLNAGIIEGRWTPQAAMAAAHLLQNEPSRDAAATCQRLGVLPYSRSTLERGGQQIGECFEEHHEAIESELMDSLEIPPEATAVAVSVDRVSLPMVEPKEDGTKEQNIVLRMAYCGLWTLYTAEGDALVSRRYGRMPVDGQDVMEDTLRADLEVLLTRRPTLKVVALADGAPDMQGMLERIVREVSHVRRGTLDIWHVLEKLGEAVDATGRKKTEAEAIERKRKELARFKMWLKTEEKGAERVLQVLRCWCRDYTLQGKAVPEKLSAALTYLTRNREGMRYKALIAEGLPIGSGPVEATCKTLVSTRMKRSGARWKTRGGQEVLTLRGLARSTQWDSGMKALQRRLQKRIQPVRATA